MLPVLLFFSLIKFHLMQELGTSVALGRQQRDFLLDYLLSTGKVENIIGIPLIKQVDGSIISLSRRSNTSPNHILLERQDQAVFSQFDPQAIPIAALSSTAIQHLKSTTLLDVEPLKEDHIMNYIDRAHSHFGSFKGTPFSTSDQYIGWVSEFLEWIHLSPLENALRGRLHDHPLLPVNSGQLKPISSGVFSPKHARTSEGLVEFLQSTGLSFLHPGISAPAQKYLDPYLNSLNNPHHVLTSLPPLNQELSSPDVHSLHGYILSHKYAIQEDQAMLAILRRLPIYDHMDPTRSPPPQSNNSMTNYLTSWSSMPNGVEIRVVAANITLLPIIPNTFFTSQLRLVQILDQTLKVTSRVDILELAICNFLSQPPDLQARFLEQIATMHIPSSSISPLKSIPFILCANGQLHAPQSLVDPTGKLANLLPPDSPHLPQYQTALQHRMVDSLRSLSLLPNTLTMEIFQEIVNIIMEKQDTRLSNSLLGFLDDDTASWSIPNLLLNSNWLDTTDGLSSPAGSHDHRFAELCNHALPLLRSVKRIQSKRLLCALHWDKPPALQIVITQFKALVTDGSPSCPELLPVTSFLGSRLKELSRNGYLQELEQFTRGRSWVPTYGPTLASTMFAIFRQDLDISPFKHILSRFADDIDARSFLQAMGCMEQ